MEADRDVVRASFDDRAAAYARNEWHRGYAEQLVALAGLHAGQHVMDAGVGTAFAAAAVARAVGPTGRVLGVDLSRGMLDHARAALDEAGLPWVELLQADATDLPAIPSEAFDAVVCSAAMLYMPVGRALIEWHRVLKPGGLVAFSTMQRGSPPAGALFRQCAKGFGVALADPSDRLGSDEACRRVLGDAGFGEVRVVAGHVDLSAADLSLAWEANLGSAGHAAVRNLTQADLDLLRARYEAALGARQSAAESPVERAAVLYAFGRR